MRTRLAEVGASLAGASTVVEYLKRSEVEQILAHCALYAHEKVNNDHFKGRNPTREQCRQVVGTDTHGKSVTRAMQLGLEKHQVAMECLKWRLELLLPGQFSLEPRYRYNSQTKEKSLMSSEEVQQLLDSGRSAELTGTLVPDVVIHLGQPLSPKAIYEFKFPCPDTNPVRWRQYPEGHPHAGKTQQQLYKEALGVEPQPVMPLRGIIR